MALSESVLESVQPEAKNLKLFDGGGLFLLVTPSGGKWWRLKYRFGGKEKLISLGVYPAVTLTEARRRRTDAKKLLAGGIDPGAARKAAKNKDEAEDAEESFRQTGQQPGRHDSGHDGLPAGQMPLFAGQSAQTTAATPGAGTTPSGAVRSYALPPGALTLEREILKGSNAEDWRDVLAGAFASIKTTARLMRHFSAPEQFDPEFIRDIADNLHAPLEVLGKVCSLVQEFEEQTGREKN